MAEVRLFYIKDNAIRISRSIEFLKSKPIESFLWIDLNNVDEEIENELEDFLKIYIQEEEEMIEIETSSRFIETTDSLVINSNFLLNTYEKEVVSCILKRNLLVTVRDQDLNSFKDVVTKLMANPTGYPTGYHVFVALFETRIEFDADLIEEMTHDITKLSEKVQEADENILLEIKNLQEKTMLLRENVIDKQRSISNFMRSQLVPNDLTDKLKILIKDINSLIEYVQFNFDRLDYLQDTFLGFVNIEQNKIIKMFTVISVIFMPPTLIASIYGMNFTNMPEIKWEYGYEFSIGMMIVAIILILFYFKKKKWL